MKAEINEMLHKLKKSCKERANYKIKENCKEIEKQSNESLAFQAIKKSTKNIKHKPIQLTIESQKMTMNKEIICDKISEFIEKTNL